jgi:hypothetical protein
VPFEPVAAAGGTIEAAQDVHQGRLAGAGGADDGQELAALDLQVDAAQGGHRHVPGAIYLYQSLEPDHHQSPPGGPPIGKPPPLDEPPDDVPPKKEFVDEEELDVLVEAVAPGIITV